MTYTPFDEKDIRYDSAVFGYGDTFVRALPSWADGQTTGGGSVDPNRRGTEITAGTTIGDTASISTEFLNRNTGNAEPIGRVIHRYRFAFNPNDTVADEINIGAVDNTVENDSGAYYAPHRDEYQVGTLTEPAPSVSSEELKYLEIDVNYDDFVTTFRLKSRQSVDDVTTIGDVHSRQDDIVRINSEGNGDTVYVTNYRVTFIPT